LNSFVSIESSLLKPVVRSGNIGRYWAKPNSHVLFPYERASSNFKLIPEDKLKIEFPNTWNYLLKNKTCLSAREHGRFCDTGWYQLYPKNLDVWDQPKIMIPYMITPLSAYCDDNDLYFVNVTTGGFGLTIKNTDISLKYLTALLNSALLDWFLKQVSTQFHGGYFAANKQFLVQLPIRTINLSDPTDKSRHDRMVELVEAMLQLNKDLPKAKTPDEKNMLQRQITATDDQIDRLVYELYDLTEEEIKIVEESCN
ncbi:MAG: restriction endonuclease subunit M, partial [Gammaproteobacteria bacterium]|nr:restriction endonuclease subunit M [Gammaproteobacteria bacterium]